MGYVDKSIYAKDIQTWFFTDKLSISDIVRRLQNEKGFHSDVQFKSLYPRVVAFLEKSKEEFGWKSKGNMEEIDEMLDIGEDQLTALEELESLETRLRERVVLLEGEQKENMTDPKKTLNLSLEKAIGEMTGRIHNTRKLMLDFYKDEELKKICTRLLKEYNKKVLDLLVTIVPEELWNDFLGDYKEVLGQLSLEYDLKYKI